MADNFRYNDEFYNSLSDEQKQALDKENENLNKFINGKAERLATEKATKQEVELEAKRKEQDEANAKINAFLNSVPNENKTAVASLMKKGFSQDEITSQFGSLLKPTKNNYDFESFMKQTDEANAKDEAINAEAYIKNFENGGAPLDMSTQESKDAWAKYERLKMKINK